MITEEDLRQTTHQDENGDIVITTNLRLQSRLCVTQELLSLARDRKLLQKLKRREKERVLEHIYGGRRR